MVLTCVCSTCLCTSLVIFAFEYNNNKKEAQSGEEIHSSLNIHITRKQFFFRVRGDGKNNKK